MSENNLSHEVAHLSDLDQVFHHSELPDTAASNFLDGIVDRIGATASWLWLLAVGVILYSVISRYVFGSGSVMLEELSWHVAGAAWLVGLSYTLVHDDHVRVDVLHERFSIKTQAWIELFGLIFLLIPFLVISLMEVAPYAYSSYVLNESSQAPAGLPFRWILKSFMPLAMVLLIIAALSRVIKTLALLFGFPRPLPKTDVKAED